MTKFGSPGHCEFTTLTSPCETTWKIVIWFPVQDPSFLNVHRYFWRVYLCLSAWHFISRKCWNAECHPQLWGFALRMAHKNKSHLSSTSVVEWSSLVLPAELLVKKWPSKRWVIDHSSLSERLPWLDIMTKVSLYMGWNKLPGGSLMHPYLSQTMEHK